MKKLLTVACVFFFTMSNAQPVPSVREQKINTLTAAEKKQGWKLLFDGKTTKGWHSYNKEEAGSAWKVKDGVLYLDTSNKKDWQVEDGGDLVNENTFSDFHLSLEWKISRAGNSGIIFYIQEDKKYDYCWLTGPEMQIVDNKEHPDGKLVKHQAGDLYDLIACSKKTVKPAGQWNKAEIIADKGKLTLKLNGVVVVQTTMWDDNWKKLIAESKFIEMPDFGKFTSGKIAVQDHGNMVSFRNIKVREL